MRAVTVGTLAVALTLATGCRSSPSNNRPVDAGDPGGNVTLWQFPPTDAGQVYRASAMFPDPLAHIGLCDLAPEHAGSCCFYPPDADAGVLIPPQLPAGIIQINDSTSATTLRMLGYAANGAASGYVPDEWLAPGWASGDLIQVGAGGDILPGFVVSARAPARVTGVHPAWDATTPITIPRSADFSIGWTVDPNAARMELTLEAGPADGGDPRGQIWCVGGEDAGQLTVPQSLLQHFQSGDTCAQCVLVRSSLGSTDDGGVTLVINTLDLGAATFGN